MADFDWMKPELPTTEQVYEAYREWYDPEYRNPEAQAKWAAVNKEEFESWLAQIKAVAWDEGVEVGRRYAEDMEYAPTNPYRS